MTRFALLLVLSVGLATGRAEAYSPRGGCTVFNSLDLPNMISAIKEAPQSELFEAFAVNDAQVDVPGCNLAGGPGGPGGGPTPTRTFTRTPTPTATVTSTPTVTPTPSYESGKLLVTLRQGATTSCLQQINSVWNVQSMEPAHGTSFEDPVLADATGLSREFLLTVPGTTNMPTMRADYADEDAPDAPCVERAGLLIFAEVPPQNPPEGGVAGIGAGCGELVEAQECTTLRDSGSELYCPTGDALFGSQHNLHNYGQPPVRGIAGVDIDAPQAWYLYQLAFPPGSSPTPVTVAVIDYGIDADHPEFSGRILSGVNTLNPANNPTDTGGHGTKVAGIIAAAMGNGFGIAGVYPNAKILPIKVCGTTGCGNSLRVTNGILWAVGQNIPGYPAAPSGADRAQVINLSVEFPDLDDVCNPGEPDVNSRDQLWAAIKYAHGLGVVLVAAAGNGRCYDSTPEDGLISECCAVTYPAAFDEVLAVSALDPCSSRLNNPTMNSNYGSQVDLSAPGALIPTTNMGNTVGGDYVDDFTGTSAASPHVAGVAALLKAYRPCLRSEEIRALLEASAVDIGVQGRDDQFGFGRVNAYNAILGAVCQAQITALQPPDPENNQTTDGFSMNGVGQVVGRINKVAASDGFIWNEVNGAQEVFNNEAPIALGDGPNVVVRDINDTGRIIINSRMNHDGGFLNRAFTAAWNGANSTWVAEEILPLGDDTSIYAQALNENNRVVGSSAYNPHRAFLYMVGESSAIDLNAAFGSTNSDGWNINNGNLILATANFGNSAIVRPLLYNHDNSTDEFSLWLPPGQKKVLAVPQGEMWADATGINNGVRKEDIVVVGATGSDVGASAVVWAWDETAQDLTPTILPRLLPPGSCFQRYASADSVNDHGVIVGHDSCASSWPDYPDNDDRAVLWQRDAQGVWTVRELHTYLTPEDQTLWILFDGMKIDNSGRVVGSGYRVGEGVRGFYLKTWLDR